MLSLWCFFKNLLNNPSAAEFIPDELSASSLDPLLTLLRDFQEVSDETFDTIREMVDVVTDLTYCVADADSRLRSGESQSQIENVIEFHVERFQLLACKRNFIQFHSCYMYIHTFLKLSHFSISLDVNFEDMDNISVPSLDYTYDACDFSLPDGQEMPKHIKYSIRRDPDDTARTSELTTVYVTSFYRFSLLEFSWIYGKYF